MKCKWLWCAGLLSGVAAGGQMDPTMEMGPTAGSAKFAGEMDRDMKQMDHAMAAAPMTGQVDHDFVVMMIPHHQGAIEMAKGELSYGTDPIMRRLAQEIIADQKSEIDLMNLWLKKQAAPGAGK
jgi:uncharacterized protein (DUF305 family)